MIYLDNAATSWPKPESVAVAMESTLRQGMGNPGRSGHRMSLLAARSIRRARSGLARLFGIRNPDDIAFTLNATWAINLALKGCLAPGDHVITSSLEHNAVTRPLWALAAAGVEVTRLPTDPRDGVDPDALRRALRPGTRMVVLTHASNVTGTVNPIGAVGRLCRDRGILFLVDAAQTAGSFPIDVEELCIDLLAFPGHKGLLGPQGTGGLYVSPAVALRPLAEGGTGSHSQSPEQPEQRPDRYESGTPNTPGIAGLGAAVEFVLEKGVGKIRSREQALVDRLVHGLADIRGVRVTGPAPGRERAATVSLIIEGLDPHEVSVILESSFDIAVRAGLQCAPDAHRSLGTLERGTIRLSPGYFTTDAEIEACIGAITAIAAAGAP